MKHILLTTPEKRDVITRKSDDLVKMVRLLILDKVYGSVLEALVARTIRLIEQSQSMIPIVGLSATLPNYEDVAAFLHPDSGILYEYQPVPLNQTVIGLRDNNELREKNAMVKVCFEKVKQTIDETNHNNIVNFYLNFSMVNIS